ncbi:MAG: choline dehydrogenase [Acidimicrobiaceae bacterium]|jgi:choline dehydrogenase|nr:choline dehydrogenase [Acidimicrobiaceae bacterium]MBT5849149.1 choline dehydrogenase [Acidimicrobiaceae bacterium]
MAEKQWDYIIIGGGSAGCALANRLSADPNTQVLVLEAGRKDWRWDVFIHMPAALTYPIGSRFYDWKYESEPEPFMGGRRVYHARGKVLGGSSSINGMIFQRGNPMDFDKWAAEPGMETWDYAHCLPYFKRMESRLVGGDKWRGEDGPLRLETGPASNPLFGAWLEAGPQAGFERTDDVNGFRQEGFAAFDKNMVRGRRLSAARAYLHPVLKRKNLTLRTLAQVNKILFEGTRAVGVEYRRGRRTQIAKGAEIISCGGAFNSPQLLQLSGIGDATHLQALGIDSVVDLPGVGANLQDHLEVYIQYSCNEPVSMQPYLAKWRMPIIGLQWLFRRGPAATNHFEAGAFVRSNDEVDYPNLMFHFLPIAIRYDGSAPEGGHGYQVHIGPMYSDVRGTVKITSTNPRTHPAVQFNYLSTGNDRREWIEAVRTARHVLNQPAFDRYNGGEVAPGPSVETDEEILEWVARDAETALHPSCTTKMGVDDMAVIDPRTMRVHGTQGLRVVDASVMPIVSNGNIYAPTMMIAEKAADMILGNEPLPPDPTVVYRAPTSH